MPRHRDKVRLLHMLDHAREAVIMLQGKTRADVDADRQLNLALCACSKSSAKRLPAPRGRTDALSRYPLEIISLRNRLIHGYDSVDFDILWNVITKDLPPLIEKLERIA